MTKKWKSLFTKFKWTVLVLFLLFMAADAVSWYLSAKLRPVISRELKDLVLNSTDSLYHVEFSTINTNYLLGNAAISDVKIIPDTLIYQKLIRLRRAPNNLYQVSLKKLTIRNFHPFSIYLNKKLHVQQLLFEHPSVVMINKQFDFNENHPPRPYKSPYAYISRFLKEVSVHTIDLQNSRFSYVNNNGPEPETSVADNLDITLKDWLIDANSPADPSRFYLMKDVLVSLNDYRFSTPDSLYHIEMNAFSFAASTGRLNIKKFAVVPRYGEMEFGSAAGYAKDRFSIQLSDISLDRINLLLYVRKHELSAGTMNISNGFVSVFNNNELPSRGVERMGKFPHQLLQALKQRLTIQELGLHNIDLSFAQFDKESRQKGKITFENTSGTIRNATNDPAAKAKNRQMTADLQTKMMGQGKLDVHFDFDLLSPAGAFAYRGKLVGMEGSVLNRITKPLGMVQVKSGVVQQLDFNIRADERQARGKMNFAYKNLSIGLLKKVPGKDHLVKMGLVSMLANALVIRPDNPDGSGKFVAAPVDFRRDPTNSFFSFIWQSLFQGIKYTVGLTPQKEAEIDAQISKFEKMKADRELRRLRRQQRNQEKM